MLQVVLIENDVDYSPFSSQVLACLPPLPWSVSSEDVSNPVRQDLRHLLVFSVDPPGMYLKSYSFDSIYDFSQLKCLSESAVVSKHINLFVVLTGCKDIDDALHCTSLPNGNFELGVRILESPESHLYMTELSI